MAEEKKFTEEVGREMLEYSLIPEEDIETLMLDWQNMRPKLDITDAVIRNAIDEWLPRTLNVEFKGVRMGVGALLRELIEIETLSRRLAAGEHVERLYGVMPVVLAPYQTLKFAGGDSIYVAFPDMVMMQTMQKIFHHASHLFEVAENNGFSYGARHCALNKMGIAGRLTGFVPEPTVMWSWGMVCDEATKLDEFLKDKQGGNWTSIITRLPHDTYWDDEDYQDDERVHYLAGSLHRAIDRAAEALGVEVKPEHMQGALQAYAGYMRKFGALSAKVASADPVPLRNGTMGMLALPATIPFNSGLEHLGKCVDVLEKEVDEAIAAGRGVTPKGAPKVGMYFNPSNNPWFEELMNKNGVAISMALPSTLSKAQMSPSKYADTYDQMAEQWLQMNFGMGCGADTRNWVEKIGSRNVDAMIVGFLDYDRWLGQVQKVGAKIVEEELGIPTFYVEGDFYEDRDYSEEALKTRIETMCSIIKMDVKKRRAKAAMEAAKAEAAK